MQILLMRICNNWKKYPDRKIECFQDMLAALEQRLRYFKKTTGTTVSDDGIPFF